MLRGSTNSTVFGILMALAVVATPSVVVLHDWMSQEESDREETPAFSASDSFDAPYGVSSKTDPTKSITVSVFDPTTAEAIDVSLPAEVAAFADALTILSFASQEHSLQQLSVRLQI